MTRETKIGLLVGLGFIIVIGILLSDHIQSSTEPPQAGLSVAAANVRSGVNAPNSSSPGAVQVTAPENVVPVSPVVTNEELKNKPEPTQVIRITQASAADSGAPLVIKDLGEKTAPSLLANGPAIELGSTNDKLAMIPETEVVKNEATPKPHARIYIANSGDSLAKMAAKMYGTDTRANRSLIVSANKELKANPTKIIAGHAYTIPGNPNEKAPVALAVTAKGSTTAPSSVATSWYTVKAGDNLWKIAKEQLGNANAVAQIRELNKESLKGDALKLNMKLKLPSRMIASVN